MVGRPAKKIVMVALVAIVVSAAAMSLRVQSDAGSSSSGQRWQSVTWRLELFGRKIGGDIPELSWSELWQMARTPGGFGLEAFVTRGVSLDGSVKSPHVQDDDIMIGARLFKERCSSCHGAEGVGWHGPALNRPGYLRGDSDLAIYKVLRDGLPNSAMVAPGLSPLERWQVGGYLRSLQIGGATPKPAAALHVDVTSAQLQSIDASSEWLTYSGAVNGQRYSRLAEITPANVSQLRMLWSHQFDNTGKIEATPLVVNGVLFVTFPPANVAALDVQSGNVIWTYTRNLPADLPLCCGLVNRGVAILGDALFLGTLDGYLVAINTRTGQPIWEQLVADPYDGYTLTGAPLIADRLVVIGTAGGEFGIRGFVDAYDPTNGARRWRFQTIPGPGEVGHESWKNDAWKTGGGPTWVTGSYDPSLNLVYWGVGNPAPDFSGDIRPGDNLFTNSAIALHADTGQLAWYFQFTPHDEHDWDSAQTPILADIIINEQPRKVICWANRNGFYYVLDRATGKFLAGVPFVELNWASALDSNGRPVLTAMSGLSVAGQLTKPGANGGANWQNPAFDPARSMVFVPATEGASVYTKTLDVRRGENGLYMGSSGIATPTTSVVRALDAATGMKKWEYVSRGADALGYSGLLATRGGLVFGASGGTVFALESATGNERWNVPLGAETRSAPVSFTRESRQVIAVTAGRTLFLFGL
jgi:alcohol dehydrogenase (cytochrome c)